MKHKSDVFGIFKKRKA